MPKTFRTLDDVDVKGKRVLLRVDLNVPMESGRVTDATRLERIAPTITEIASKGGKVILLAHFGRPKGRDAKDSLKPVAEALAKVVKKPVAFAEDCVGEPAAKAIAAMKDGDILCLENTRFHKEEEKNDPAFVGEADRLSDHQRQFRGDGFQRLLGVAPLGPAEMREQDHLAALAGNLGDGRRDALQPRGVADAAAVHGHVEVDAQQHAFALYVDVIEGTELFFHWRLARAHPSRRLASLGSSG